jgi:hypothetical protein
VSGFAIRSRRTIDLKCPMCGRNIELFAETTDDPEAPELFQIPRGVRIGFTSDPLTIHAVCAGPCVDAFFRAEERIEDLPDLDPD